MALRWREPIHLRWALAKEGYHDSLSAVWSRTATVTVTLAACLLLLTLLWAGPSALGVALVSIALTMLASLSIPWFERLTHRSILINPEGLTVFGSTTASLAGFFGADSQRYSIDSIRAVSLEQINVRGNEFPAIVFDLHNGTPVAVGLRKDQAPSELRRRLQEWGYSFANSRAG